MSYTKRSHFLHQDSKQGTETFNCHWREMDRQSLPTVAVRKYKAYANIKLDMLTSGKVLDADGFERAYDLFQATALDGELFRYGGRTIVSWDVSLDKAKSVAEMLYDIAVQYQVDNVCSCAACSRGIALSDNCFPIFE
jgi:hypothetical protein